MKTDAFKDRLKIAMGNTSIRSFADQCEISEGTMRRYLNGDGTPTLDKLKVISNISGYNLAWLAEGKGPMRPGEVVQGRLEAGGDAEHKAIQGFEPVEGVTLQVYFAGGAGDPFELVPSEPIEEIVIPKAFYTPSIVPVKVQGRSMSPTMRDGAIVGVDRSDRRIVNGELYAVWLPYQGAVIKRLYLDAKKILLQSDNEEFRSHDIEVDLGEVDEHFVQGRVKWVMQML